MNIKIYSLHSMLGSVKMLKILLTFIKKKKRFDTLYNFQFFIILNYWSQQEKYFMGEILQYSKLKINLSLFHCTITTHLLTTKDTLDFVI